MDIYGQVLEGNVRKCLTSRIIIIYILHYYHLGGTRLAFFKIFKALGFSKCRSETLKSR